MVVNTAHLWLHTSSRLRKAVAVAAANNKLPFLCLVVLAGLEVPAAAEFTIPPYIQNPGTTTMTLMWESDTLGVATVTVGRETADSKIITAPEPVTTTYHQRWDDPSSPEETRYVYSTKLTGLRPGTKYSYRVNMGDCASEPSAFKTFPEQADTFTFIVYGDSRSGVSSHRKLAANFAQYDPAFILHTGDMVGTGKSHVLWHTEFFAPLAGVIDHIPVLGARGNHEADGANMDLYFSPPDGTFGYAFDYGTAHILCLGMNANADAISWADNDLAATTAAWRFAFYHTPSFNVGGHASSWGRDTVVPMLRKYRIDLAFSGHSHLYERFHPLVPLREPQAHPVTYLVTGGGGAPAYDTAANPCVAKFGNMLHFLVVAVAGDAVTVEARGVDNALIDSFTIRKRNGTYDEEYLAKVMPEEGVTLHNTLRRSMHFEASAVPDPANPADVTCNYSRPGIEFPVNVTVSLDEESQGAYTTEPATWAPNLTSDDPGTVTFKVRSKGKVTADKRGKLSPPLVFACRYKLGKIEGKVTQRVDLKTAEDREKKK